MICMLRPVVTLYVNKWMGIVLMVCLLATQMLILGPILTASVQEKDCATEKLEFANVLTDTLESVAGTIHAKRTVVDMASVNKIDLQTLITILQEVMGSLQPNIGILR